MRKMKLGKKILCCVLATTLVIPTTLSKIGLSPGVAYADDDWDTSSTSAKLDWDFDTIKKKEQATWESKIQMQNKINSLKQQKNFETNWDRFNTLKNDPKCKNAYNVVKGRYGNLENFQEDYNNMSEAEKKSWDESYDYLKDKLKEHDEQVAYMKQQGKLIALGLCKVACNVIQDLIPEQDKDKPAGKFAVALTDLVGGSALALAEPWGIAYIPMQIYQFVKNCVSIFKSDIPKVQNEYMESEPTTADVLNKLETMKKTQEAYFNKSTSQMSNIEYLVSQGGFKSQLDNLETSSINLADHFLLNQRWSEEVNFNGIEYNTKDSSQDIVNNNKNYEDTLMGSLDKENEWADRLINFGVQAFGEEAIDYPSTNSLYSSFSKVCNYIANKNGDENPFQAYLNHALAKEENKSYSVNVWNDYSDFRQNVKETLSSSMIYMQYVYNQILQAYQMKEKVRLIKGEDEAKNYADRYTTKISNVKSAITNMSNDYVAALDKINSISKDGFNKLDCVDVKVDGQTISYASFGEAWLDVNSDENYLKSDVEIILKKDIEFTNKTVENSDFFTSKKFSYNDKAFGYIPSGQKYSSTSGQNHFLVAMPGSGKLTVNLNGHKLEKVDDLTTATLQVDRRNVDLISDTSSANKQTQQNTQTSTIIDSLKKNTEWLEKKQKDINTSRNDIQSQQDTQTSIIDSLKKKNKEYEERQKAMNASFVKNNSTDGQTDNQTDIQGDYGTINSVAIFNNNRSIEKTLNIKNVKFDGKSSLTYGVNCKTQYGLNIDNCYFTGYEYASPVNIGSAVDKDTLDKYTNKTTIQNTKFISNKAASGSQKKLGGAICAGDFVANFNVVNCTFNSNSALEDAGAIMLRNADLYWSPEKDDKWGQFTQTNIVSCTFDGNQAGEAGGAIWSNNILVAMADCKFLNNKAKGGGGAIKLADHLEDKRTSNWGPHCGLSFDTTDNGDKYNYSYANTSGLALHKTGTKWRDKNIQNKETVFRGNQSTNSNGGALEVTSRVAPYFEGRFIFENNKAAGTGGAIHLHINSSQTETWISVAPDTYIYARKNYNNSGENNIRVYDPSKWTMGCSYLYFTGQIDKNSEFGIWTDHADHKVIRCINNSMPHDSWIATKLHNDNPGQKGWFENKGDYIKYWYD